MDIVERLRLEQSECLKPEASGVPGITVFHDLTRTAADEIQSLRSKLDALSREHELLKRNAEYLAGGHKRADELASRLDSLSKVLVDAGIEVRDTPDGIRWRAVDSSEVGGKLTAYYSSEGLKRHASAADDRDLAAYGCDRIELYDGPANERDVEKLVISKVEPIEFGASPKPVEWLSLDEMKKLYPSE